PSRAARPAAGLFGFPRLWAAGKCPAGHGAATAERPDTAAEFATGVYAATAEPIQHTVESAGQRAKQSAGVSTAATAEPPAAGKFAAWVHTALTEHSATDSNGAAGQSAEQP